MKKSILLIILAIFIADNTLFAQVFINGRVSSVTPQKAVIKTKPIVPEPKFISNQDNPNKQVITEDLIVHGNIGIGNDVPATGYVFGYNTLAFMENNLRIYFDDTSNSSTFPNNDWTIEINETANGGTNHFAILDATSGTVPFKIMAGAPTSSLFVAANSNIGLGTSNPATDLHMVEGDTPTLRLDQDGSAGYTAQVWDIAGNESNFFVRDVTNGSTLPFRIQPNAPTNTLTLLSSGNVGIGTWSPTDKLHVTGDVRIDSTLKIFPRTDFPLTVTEGSIYMDGNDHFLKYYNGTDWNTINNTDEQELGLTANILSISGGSNIFNLTSYLDNTDEQ